MELYKKFDYSFISLKNIVSTLLIISLFFLFNINIIIKYGIYIEPFENIEIYIFDFFLLLIVIFCFLLKPIKLSDLLSYKGHYLILLLLSLYFLNSVINNSLSLKVILSLTRLLQFYTVAYFLNNIFNHDEIKKMILNFIIIYISFFIIETIIIKYNCIKPYIEYWYINKDVKYVPLSIYGDFILGLFEGRPYYLYFSFIFKKDIMMCLASKQTYFTVNNILVFCLLIFFSFIQINLKNKIRNIFLFIGMIFSLSLNLFLSLLLFIILKIKKNIYKNFTILLISSSIFIIFYVRKNEFMNFEIDSSLSIRIFLIYKYFMIFFQNNMYLGSGLLEATNPELHKSFYDNFQKMISNNNFFNAEQIHSFDKFYKYEFNFFKLPYNIQSTHNFYIQMLVELGIVFSIVKLYLIKLLYNASSFKKTLFIIGIWLIFNSWFPGNPETLVILILLLSKMSNAQLQKN